MNTDNLNESASKPLVNWPNAPTLMNLKQDLLDTQTTHSSQVTKIGTWLDNLNVTGKAQVVVKKGNSSIVPKLIRKQAEWRYAALSEPFLSSPDVFNVNPRTFEDRDSAEQNQMLLNHQFNNEIDKIHFIDEYVRTAVDEGTVITRVGWDFEEEEVTEMVPIIEYRINPAMVEKYTQIQQLQQQSPSEFDDLPEELKKGFELSIQNQMPMEGIVVGQREEKVKKIVKNVPTIEVCDYRNVILDPTCMGDIDKAGFLIYRFETNLSELEKDGKYSNLDVINVDNSSILGLPDDAGSSDTKTFNFKDEPRKKFIAHEYWGYWDINKTGIVEPIVVTWVGDTIIRMSLNPFPDKKIPFVIEQYLPVRKNNYGEPDGSLLEDNQRVIGAVTRGMIDIMGKSANGQTGTQKGLLDVTNRRKYERGDDYEYNPIADPRLAIYMHTYPEIPQSAQFMLQLQNMEAESLTGVKSFSQGVSGQSLGDVAAGVRGALDAASKRELGILRRLSNGMVKIARKIVAMNAVFLSETEVIRVTNNKFVTIRKSDLSGKFDLAISISTAEEDNNKAEQLAFMLQTMGNSMDPQLAKTIFSDIAKLRKMPDLAKRIEDYQPQPDPIQQEKAQLEIELLKAQIAKENAQAMHFQANAQLGGAKANTESAKQANIKSDTDIKNLDFVEQESGVKQERDKELYGEQARSQAQLKLLDHSFQREKLKTDVVKELIKNNSKAKQ